MPEISTFFGIVVYMLYGDHSPPHFHARYGDFEILVEIESGIVEGRFPRKALKAVLDWHELHRQELMVNWTRAEERKELLSIPPLG